LGAALGTVLSRIMMVFMHYLMKRNADLKKYFKILVLKKSESQFEKNINLGFLSDANVV
jgi:MATE family multidrug resistance protein